MAAAVFAAATLVAATSSAPLFARLAGTVVPLRPRSGVVEATRAGAAAASVALLAGSDGADLLVAALLAAFALGRRSLPLATSAVLVAGVGLTRAGSSDLGDVSGAHAVLGPALSSPEIGVAFPAACVVAAGFVGILAALPRQARLGLALRSAPAFTDAVLPALLGLLVLAVAAGPPVAPGAESEWLAVRTILTATGLVAAVLVRRLLPAACVRFLAPAALVLAAAALGVAVGSA